MPHLGPLLRRRRKRLGIDQRSLAELAGISTRTLSDIETGAGNPTLEVLDRVCEALGLEVSVRLRTAAEGAVPEAPEELR